MTTVQHDALERAAGILGEHFDHHLIAVTAVARNGGGEECHFKHGGSRVAALGLAVDAQFDLAGNEDQEKWRDG